MHILSVCAICCLCVVRYPQMKALYRDASCLEIVLDILRLRAQQTLQRSFGIRGSCSVMDSVILA